MIKKKKNNVKTSSQLFTHEKKKKRFKIKIYHFVRNIFQLAIQFVFLFQIFMKTSTFLWKFSS